MRRRGWPTAATTLALAVVATGLTARPAAAATDPPPPPSAVVDQFSGTSLDGRWEVVNADPARYSLTEKPGFLRVHSLKGDTWQHDNTARNLVLRSVPDSDFEVVTRLSAPVTLDYQSAGILAWQDTDNYVRAGLAHVGSAGGQVIETALERSASFSSSFTPRPGSAAEVLKVTRRGDVFTTSYWTGTAWAQAGQVTAELAVKQIGLFAFSAQNGTPVTADFDYLAVASAPDKALLPTTPFALEGVDGLPYLSADASGEVRASADRSANQLVLVAKNAGDGTMTLQDVASRAFVSTPGRDDVRLSTTPAAGTDRFGMVDAGGDTVHVQPASGGWLRVLGHRLAVTKDPSTAIRFRVRSYSSLRGDLSVAADAPGKKISDTLYGVFYEDINHAADGGLYAELVQNRSFEFTSTDNRSYTPLTAWSKVERGGATGSITVDSAQPLNADNLNSLALTLGTAGSGDAAGVGVRNAGFNKGIALAAGATYDLSVWARTTAPAGTPLRISVESQDGSASFGGTSVVVRTDTWQKYTSSFTAAGTTNAGSLVVLGQGTGTVRLDMVSLFPRDTFKGHGMRTDLATLIADLEPKFLRFPGGCVANVGNYAPFPDRRRIYRWKETIGPVEQRPTNVNFWGYNQSYGIGYYEYFQFAEDIGATPLPVLSVGVNGCDENRPLPVDQLGPWIQDTLDLIEFANGPATSPWGAKRAALGHRKPFNLTYIALGNEEIYPEFYRNYPYFAKAIHAKYPNIKIISNTGQRSAGAIFDRGWEFARAQRADLVDEHYYNSPEWFLANNHRYDTYDRTGPHVFVGEYASRGNTFYNALSEASFLTGIERNGDVVELASYAPLLANIDYVTWAPDLIWYDNQRSYGSSSYHVQRMFSNNAGDTVLPSTYADPDQAAPTDISGGISLGSWNTQVEYDDVVVTGSDGRVLLDSTFSGDATGWQPASGSWSVRNGVYAQTSNATDARSVAGSGSWTNYTISLKAKKTGGAEGFLVGFGVQDTGNFYWWNLGGWGNTTSAVERAVNGAKTTVAGSGTTIQTGRTYDIRISVTGRTVTTYLDGVQVNRFTDTGVAVEPLYQVVTRDSASGDTVVKVVNARPAAVRTTIRLGGIGVANRAEVTSLTSASPSDVNTLAEPRRTAPVTQRIGGVSSTFSYDFPAYSVTFLRFKRA
jgi:alpha-L-arabinofuranosidase